jgi:hypothetical protein
MDSCLRTFRYGSGGFTYQRFVWCAVWYALCVVCFVWYAFVSFLCFCVRLMLCVPVLCVVCALCGVLCVTSLCSVLLLVVCFCGVLCILCSDLTHFELTLTNLTPDLA